MNKIKAKYTLSDGSNIYISKGKTYTLHFESKQLFIIDNTGNKINLTKELINERFEVITSP